MFSQADLAAMQDVQESHMGHTCVLQTLIGTTDVYGQPGTVFIEGQPMQCGLEWTSTQRAAAGRGPVLEIDARLRLPLGAGAVVNPQQRVKVTHLYGLELVQPWVFTVVGQPQVGPSCVVLELKRFG